FARDELLRMTHLELTPPERRDLEARLARTVAETGVSAGYEKEYLRRDGSRIAASVSLFAIPGGNGNPVRLGAVVRVLARGVAHDFNNVLGTVVGHLTLAQQMLPADTPALETLLRANAAVLRA